MQRTVLFLTLAALSFFSFSVVAVAAARDAASDAAAAGPLVQQGGAGDDEGKPKEGGGKKDDKTIIEIKTKRKKDTRPLPPLPREQLPEATGPKPDPEKEQFRRAPVHVRIDEFVFPRVGEPYIPDTPVVQRYVAEYFRRAGHPVVDEPAGAAFTVAGNFEARFQKDLRFKGQLVAVKFEADASLNVVDAEGELVGSFEVQGLESEGIVPGAEVEGFPGRRRLEKTATREVAPNSREEVHAVLDLRREMARELWRKLYHRDGPFSDGRYRALVEALTRDDAAGDSADTAQSTSGDALFRQLVEARFDVVPLMLDALTDERPVVVPMDYPGLTPLNAKNLRVYHIADKVLEEIFQKVSRMGLDTSREHRFFIIKGWENEWRRFCPAYRESPTTSREEEQEAGER